ncbi:carbohydrate-binding family 9-like protein [Salinibacter sp. 10B]|uniref:carbohydrate-binding family 9-like protein n=1 Tax=Salinibacter sp. 10B TaxID=1923971 RepID=UPI000CF40C6C|nr:carbohydrate-binding family 9-like protein [Salinibacter sp. 10B]
MTLRRLLVLWMLGVLAAFGVGPGWGTAQAQSPSNEQDRLPYNPRTYTIYRADSSISVDGAFHEASWQAAPWTTEFVDIRGGDAPTPQFRTRAKMVWDDDALYVAAQLEEPDVWGTLTQRDTVIYYDNDFEVFIDPTGSTHNYYEVEVNALETVWDLMLTKPYRDGGSALDAWDIRGIDVAVQVQGTLNDPSDTDEGWTVEMALPWRVLEEAAPEGRPPQPGDQWRLNFSRVQWPTTVVNGRYRKDIDSTKAHPENNWVWSPQGVIDMHRPERWGIVQFTDVVAGADPVPVAEQPNRAVKWALRQLYYRQRDYREAHGTYASSLSALDADEISLEDRPFTPTLQATQSMYEITAPGANDTTVHIRHDGKVWTTAN